MGCSVSVTSLEPLITLPNKWCCAFDLRVAEYYDYKHGSTGTCACDLHFLSRNISHSISSCWSAVPNTDWWEERLRIPVHLNDQEWIWATMCGRMDAFQREASDLNVRAHWGDIRTSHTRYTLVMLTLVYAWPTLLQYLIDKNPLGVLHMTTRPDPLPLLVGSSFDLSETADWIDLQRIHTTNYMDAFFKHRSERLQPKLSPHLMNLLPSVLVNMVYAYLDLSTL